MYLIRRIAKEEYRGPLVRERFDEKSKQRESPRPSKLFLSYSLADKLNCSMIMMMQGIMKRKS